MASNRLGDLLERVKHILDTVLDKFDEAAREKEIIRLLQSIEEKLASLGAANEAETVALLRSKLERVVQKLESVSQ